MNNRLVIRLSLTCNNHCKFCVFGKEREKIQDRTERQIKEILNCNRNYRSVVFTGGEPCLRPDLINLVTYAKSMGFKEVQIQSNGRMFIYKGFCRELISAGTNEFALAIHGPNPKIHDHLTSIKGSFRQALQGMENLKRLGQYVITNTVITKTNYKFIPQIAKMLIGLGIEHFQLSFIHIIGMAWENRDWIVPRKSEVIPYIKEAIGIGIKANKRVTTEAIPYCLMQGYENSIVESFIPKSKVFELDLTIEDLKAHRVYEKKTKRKGCIKCKYYGLCEGPWKEYPGLFGWDEFISISNGKDH